MKNPLKILLIFLAVLTVSFLVFYFGILNIWQEKVLDKFFVAKSPSADIVVFAIDNESLAKIGKWSWPRTVFADAINKLQLAKVVGIDINFSESSNLPEDALLGQAIENSKPKVVLPVQINTVTQEVVEPLAIFKNSALLGHVNLVNEDGVIRKVTNTQQSFDSFGAVLAKQFTQNLVIPGAMRIDYVGPESAFTTIPISDLLAGKVPESVYQNKMVLIGATAPDLHDSAQTPFGLVSGVKIHANSINTLLSQKFYQDLPWFVSFLLLLLFNAVGTAAAVKIKKFPWLVTALLVTFLAINLFGILLFSFHIIFPILYINFGFLLTAGTFIIFQYITESKEKKFIYDSFKYYLAPDIINEIIKDPAKLKIGGERKRITILLSDIRGFTTLAEAVTPEQLGHMLSEYFTAMGEVIVRHSGLVVEYVGDAAMAFWGAPLPNKYQARDACRGALEMIGQLQKVNQRWKDAGIDKTLDIGIGLSTGEVVVGNFGSTKRFRYTAIGDQINFAARIESLNKVYGSHVIIAESTKKEIEGETEFFVRQLDTIIVKGKKEPKVIFELMQKPLPVDVLAHFNAGREFYKKGDWANAIKEFSQSASADQASAMYVVRCQELLQNPPAEWNGVYEFKSK